MDLKFGLEQTKVQRRFARLEVMRNVLALGVDVEKSSPWSSDQEREEHEVMADHRIFPRPNGGARTLRVETNRNPQGSLLSLVSCQQ